MWRLRHLLDRITLHGASLESYPSIFNVVEHVKPDECYHLAAQSFVTYSFEDEFSTFDTNINGTHSILSAFKLQAPGLPLLLCRLQRDVRQRPSKPPRTKRPPSTPARRTGFPRWRAST